MNLLHLHLSVEPSSGRLLFAPPAFPSGSIVSPTLAAAAANGGGGGSRRGSRVVGAGGATPVFDAPRRGSSSVGLGLGRAPPRRVTPADFNLLLPPAVGEDYAGGPQATTMASALSPELTSALTALVHARFVGEFGLVPRRVGGRVTFASPNVVACTAETVFVFCPPAGCPAGVWSLPVVLLLGPQEGTALVYLSALRSNVVAAGSGGGGGGKVTDDGWVNNPVGVVLAAPFPLEGEAGGEGGVGAHMSSLFTEYLSPPTRGGGGLYPGTPDGPYLLFVAAGSGASAALALLTDATVGGGVRARTRGIALIEPPVSPRIVAAAAAGGGGGG